MKAPFQKRAAVRVPVPSLTAELAMMHLGQPLTLRAGVTELSDSGAVLEMTSLCPLISSTGVVRFVLPSTEAFTLDVQVIRALVKKDPFFLSLHNSCFVAVRFIFEHERTRDKLVKWILAHDLCVKRYRP